MVTQLETEAPQLEFGASSFPGDANTVDDAPLQISTGEYIHSHAHHELSLKYFVH